MKKFECLKFVATLAICSFLFEAKAIDGQNQKITPGTYTDANQLFYSLQHPMQNHILITFDPPLCDQALPHHVAIPSDLRPQKSYKPLLAGGAIGLGIAGIAFYCFYYDVFSNFLNKQNTENTPSANRGV